MLGWSRDYHLVTKDIVCSGRDSSRRGASGTRLEEGQYSLEAGSRGRCLVRTRGAAVVLEWVKRESGGVDIGYRRRGQDGWHRGVDIIDHLPLGATHFQSVLPWRGDLGGRPSLGGAFDAGAIVAPRWSAGTKYPVSA